MATEELTKQKKFVETKDVLDARKAADDRFANHHTVKSRMKIGATIGGAALALAGAGSTISSNATSTPPSPPSVLALQQGGDGPFNANKNHQRWPIKTSVSADPSLSKPVAIDVVSLANFPPEKESAKAFDKTFIPESPDKANHEGQMVTTEGYVHLVAFEVDDDSDYHIQINDKKTNSPADLSPCLIVEIPHPQAAATPDLALKFAAARKTLRDQCFDGAIPNGTVATPLHVRVTGQLFYDLSHVATPSDPGGGRGKTVAGTKMHATTCWELHPVTQIEILP